jgi:hypothetical protein
MIKMRNYMTENELTFSEYVSCYEIKQPVDDLLTIVERIKLNCLLLEKMVGKDPSSPKSELSLILEVLRHKVWNISENREYIMKVAEMVSLRCNALYRTIVKTGSKDDAIAAKLILLVLTANIEKIKGVIV